MKSIRLSQAVTAVFLLILLTACRGGPLAGQEPPRPTIVAVDTPTVTPVPATPTSTPPPLPPTPAPTSTPPPAPVDTPDTATAPPPSPTPLPPTATPSEPALDSLAVRLIPVAEGFTRPVHLTTAGDGSGRLFVVEQPGKIWIVQDGQVNPTPFLDITDRVGSDAYEQGLLSVAFHPDYPTNGRFFVDYTNKQGDTVISRFQVSPDPNRADPASEVILLTIAQPYVNHNGGQIAFGPDGYLYVGMGDGGSANDPQNNAQNLNTLLGKILRLDVDRAEPYGAPETNPFANRPDARPEIWSYGWRNPWRFSFDPATGDMYIGDVGQNRYEEISFEPAGSPGGLNYGWRLMEGLHCFNPPDCNPADLPVVLPIAEYSHDFGCSVTGGHVYRGSAFPALTGVYFYGDFCSGIIWGLRRQADGGWSQAKLLESGLSISSFGQDEAGEVYVVDHQGGVYQVGY